MAEDPNVIDMQKFFHGFLPKGKGGPGLIILVVLVVIVLFKAVTVIPAGHVGVKDLFGNVSDEVLPAGFHLINPLLRVHVLSVRTQELTEESSVPSREGLNVSLDVSLLYSLMPTQAPAVYKSLGDRFIPVLVIPTLRSAVRGVTASYEAKALYTSERELIANQMYAELKPVLESRGVLVEKVLLRSVTLPKILSTAIEKKLEAEQQSEQMKFVLTREKQEADRKRVEAQGIADFQRIVSEGLTPSFLRWKGIEATSQLASSANAKTVVIGGGKDGLPIILGGE